MPSTSVGAASTKKPAGTTRVHARWADWSPPGTAYIHLEPLFPVLGFAPDVACPHRGPIRDDSDFCCMACDKASGVKERIIRFSPAPPPVEVEIRVERLKQMKIDGLVAMSEQEQVDRLIARLEEIAKHYRLEPPKHVPHPGGLKGGVG